MTSSSRLFAIIVLTGVLLAGFLTAQQAEPGSEQENPPAPSQTKPPLRTVEQNSFSVGEELFFDVDFGFITAGKAKMSIPRYAVMDGRKCYYIQFTVNSTGFFDNFYKVRDKYESYLDADGLFPLKFIQTIREGSYKRDFNAVFDHEKRTATTPDGVYKIEPFVQDVLSAFYFMRTYDYSGFRPGQKVYLKNFYKDSTYVLTVKYLGKQTIDVEAGTFNTILLEPIMKEGGLFKASGRIIVWITDDEKRVPVQVDAQIPIGSITSELTSYKGLASPIRARVK